jgi:hypothetical protein
LNRPGSGAWRRAETPAGGRRQARITTRPLERKISAIFDKLSISAFAVRRDVEGEQTSPTEITRGDDMPQYLVAIHLPDDYDPSAESEATVRDIAALNKEMIAAGVRTFVGGLEPAGKAKSLRAQSDGRVLVTDGPYIESKEHVGGFWILDAADLDEALAWGRKAAKACRAPVEVRAIFQKPTATTN